MIGPVSATPSALRPERSRRGSRSAKTPQLNSARTTFHRGGCCDGPEKCRPRSCRRATPRYARSRAQIDILGTLGVIGYELSARPCQRAGNSLVANRVRDRRQRRRARTMFLQVAQSSRASAQNRYKRIRGVRRGQRGLELRLTGNGSFSAIAMAPTCASAAVVLAPVNGAKTSRAAGRRKQTRNTALPCAVVNLAKPPSVMPVVAASSG